VREITWRHYLNRSTLWMVLTAVGTVGYTLFDKVAAEIVRSGPATAARYGYVFFTVSFVVYAALRALFVRGGERDAEIGWWWPAAAMTLNFGAYWLVLWAYQLSPRASYIVAFRQFSIVVGVVAAFLLFRERGLGIRLTATLLILLGLLIIGLLGG
jgi:drug/metabolite transporter (DMT)-like permease